MRAGDGVVYWEGGRGRSIHVLIPLGGLTETPGLEVARHTWEFCTPGKKRKGEGRGESGSIKINLESWGMRKIRTFYLGEGKDLKTKKGKSRKNAAKSHQGTMGKKKIEFVGGWLLLTEKKQMRKKER